MFRRHMSIDQMKASMKSLEDTNGLPCSTLSLSEMGVSPMILMPRSQISKKHEGWFNDVMSQEQLYKIRHNGLHYWIGLSIAIIRI